MKKTVQLIKLQAGNLNSTQIRVMWLLLTLLLFVLGAGAPEGSSGWGG